MNSKAKEVIQFWLGVAGFITVVIGGFCHLGFPYYVTILASSLGLMRQKSIWEKMFTLMRRK
jgi:hypothetical protein